MTQTSAWLTTTKHRKVPACSSRPSQLVAGNPNSISSLLVLHPHRRHYQAHHSDTAWPSICFRSCRTVICNDTMVRTLIFHGHSSFFRHKAAGYMSLWLSRETTRERDGTVLLEMWCIPSKKRGIADRDAPCLERRTSVSPVSLYAASCDVTILPPWPRPHLSLTLTRGIPLD